MEHLVLDADLAGVELWVGPASQVRMGNMAAEWGDGEWGMGWGRGLGVA